MGRITVFENPADLSDCRQFEHVGPYIDFLSEYFPNGFGGRNHTTVINGDKLLVEDYDREIGESDSVGLIILPALPAGVIVGIGMLVINYIMPVVISAVISQVLNYAINAFFGPKGTKPTSPNPAGVAVSGGPPAASPTYTLGIPSNQARLGQPIPVAYGNNLIVPDLATQPYGWFYENQHYVGIILCLGQGYFDIEQILVANTDTASLAPGVVTTTVFPPNVHLQEFGRIQDTVNFYENVYTSPEVSDQEFTAPMEAELPGGGGGGTYGAALWWGSYGGSTGYFFTLSSPATEIAGVWRSKPVWMIVTANGGATQTYRLGWFADTTLNEAQGNYAQIGHADLTTPWPGNFGTIQFTLTDPAYLDEGGGLNPARPGGAASGPYMCTPPGLTTSHLQYDVVFPSGCYDSDPNTGRLVTRAVTLQFYAEPVDDAGNVIGEGILYTANETFATTTPQRITYNHILPEGRYRVTGSRPSAKSGQASSQSNVVWVGLKAILGNTEGGPVYRDTTLIAVLARATEGLASDALNRMSVRATRISPVTGVVSRNPANALIDIITNTTYGAKRPSTEIDWITFNCLRDKWEDAEKVFDAVYDTQTNVWEAMRMSIQVVNTSPTMMASTISLVEDVDYEVPEFSLSEDQIKTLSLTFLFPDGNEVDGIEVEYRDPNDTAQVFAIYPPTSSSPEGVTLFGCRNYDQALAYAKRRWNQLRLRRLLLNAEVELEGEVIRVGAPVCIQHTLLGPSSVLCVVQAVKPKDEFTYTLELHRHEPGVYV